MKREISGVDFSDFPEKIALDYGIDGQREWYEHWEGKKGIVIQRGAKTEPFYIFVLDSEAVRTYPKVFWKIEEAVKELEKLGFKVKVENESRMPS